MSVHSMCNHSPGPDILCYRISSQLSVERFYTIVQFKSLRGLADPGEAVGLLAAQVRLN